MLWKRDYPRFKRFIALYVGLTFVGYVGYVLYPAMPPWLASDTGYMPVISRIVPAVWSNVGVHEAAALFLHGGKVANDIAAMPSMHAAYPMLLLLFFWARARPWMRVLLVGYVLAMAFSLELAGWCAAAAVYFGGSRLLDWRPATAAAAGAVAAAAAVAAVAAWRRSIPAAGSAPWPPGRQPRIH